MSGESVGIGIENIDDCEFTINIGDDVVIYTDEKKYPHNPEYYYAEVDLINGAPELSEALGTEELAMLEHIMWLREIIDTCLPGHPYLAQWRQHLADDEKQRKELKLERLLER